MLKTRRWTIGYSLLAAPLAIAAITSSALLLPGIEPVLDGPLTPVGELRHAPIREASGLTKSRQFAGVFWTLSDSGNPPNIYAVTREGELIAEYTVRSAVNIDWESLTTDDAGFLYIGEVGNNGGRLPLRSILKVREPNPRVPAANQIGVVEIDAAYHYVFDETPFDVEGLFVQGATCYLISKAGGNAGLFSVMLDKPGERRVVKRICTLPNLPQVTGAELSATGNRLAICSYDYAVAFDLDPGQPMEQLSGRQPDRISFAKTGIEACAWSEETLILVSEDRHMYSLRFSK